MLIMCEKLLFTIALLAVLSMIVMQAPQWYTTLLPGIQKVEVAGNFIHIDRLKIEKAIHDAVTGDFFDVDMDALTAQLQRMQWIKHVWIERVWPHTLLIRIEERRALAQWKDQALVDEEGRLFTVEDASKPALPIIHGEPERSQFLLRMYRRMNQSLQTVGLSIHLLEESARGTLHLVLSNGWHLQLGKKQWERRLERFIQVHQRVSLQTDAAFAAARCFDFRYTHGFTVSQNDVECFS